MSSQMNFKNLFNFHSIGIEVYQVLTFDNPGIGLRSLT